jgi:hypothetical protein
MSVVVGTLGGGNGSFKRLYEAFFTDIIWDRSEGRLCTGSWHTIIIIMQIMTCMDHGVDLVQLRFGCIGMVLRPQPAPTSLAAAARGQKKREKRGIATFGVIVDYSAFAKYYSGDT